MKLSSDIQRRLEAHLDAIDRVLMNDGAARSERRSVTDEVEGQIREMLAERTAGKPTLADLEAVLAELDPPEAYGDPDAETVPQPAPSQERTVVGVERSRLSPLALAAAIAAGLALLMLLPIARTIAHLLIDDPVTVGTWYGFLLYLLPSTGATVLGLLAIQQIRHRPHQYHGMALALLSALLYPMLISYGLIYYLGAAMESLVMRMQFVPLPVRHGFGLVTLAMVIAGAVGLTWWTLNRVRDCYQQYSNEVESAVRPRGEAVHAASAPVPPTPTEQPYPPRLSRTALLGAVWVMLAFPSWFVMGFVGQHRSRMSAMAPEFGLYEIALLPILIFILAAPIGVTLMGLIAIGQIRHSGGRLYGMTLAMFDALLFPLLLLNLLLTGLLFFVTAPFWPCSFILVAIFLVIVNWLLIRTAWRVVSRPPATVAHAGCTY